MTRRTAFKVVISLLLAAFVFGCGDTEQGKKQPENTKSSDLQKISGRPEEYFPTQVGLQWTYDVAIMDAEPLRYSEIVWPEGQGAIKYANRGRFLPVSSDRSKKSFRIVMRTKAKAIKQGSLQYPQGVELEIIEDGLGAFEDAKQVFWAISTQDKYMVLLVVTYDAVSARGLPTFGPYGGWGRGDGQSARILFFDDQPRIQAGLGQNPVDKLLFAGVDVNVHKYSGQALLHFIRTVEGDKSKENKNELGSSFTEDMWFAKDKGLVRLEQKIEGKTSMIWALTTVSKN